MDTKQSKKKFMRRGVAGASAVVASTALMFGGSVATAAPAHAACNVNPTPNCAPTPPASDEDFKDGMTCGAMGFLSGGVLKGAVSWAKCAAEKI